MGYPVCIVKVYGQNGFWDFTGTTESRGTPSNDLISVRTDKRLGVESPAGVFDMRLTAARDRLGLTWQDRIRAQDIVVIEMTNYQGRTGEHGMGETHSFIGFVDRVSEVTVLNAQGIPQRQIQVFGRDAGKVFISGMVNYFTFAGALFLGLNTFSTSAQDYFNTKPDILIERLLRKVFNNFFRLRLKGPGGDIDFFDLLGWNLSTFSGEIPAGLDSQFIAGEGTFWSFFTKIASPPFHELFVDTRRANDVNGGSIMKTNQTLGADGSCPVLTLRPAPFPYLQPDGTAVRAAWDALTMHTIGQDDLVGEASSDILSRGDAEQYNVYLALGEYNAIDKRMQILNIPPIIDEAKFHRYGYRPMIIHTWMMKMDGDAAPFTKFFQGLTRRLASWYCLNDEFLSGTKTLKLSPHLHIGERMLDRSNGKKAWQFYIESLSHVFVVNERASTTVGVTRGLLQTDYDRYTEKLNNAGLTFPKDAIESNKRLRVLLNIKP